MRISTPFAAS
jgi:putative SOS response-associated peptidase YedK